MRERMDHDRQDLGKALPLPVPIASPGGILGCWCWTLVWSQVLSAWGLLVFEEAIVLSS